MKYALMILTQISLLRIFSLNFNPINQDLFFLNLIGKINGSKVQDNILLYYQIITTNIEIRREGKGL